MAMLSRMSYRDENKTSVMLKSAASSFPSRSMPASWDGGSKMISSSRPLVSGTALRYGTEPTRNGASDFSRFVSRSRPSARFSRSIRSIHSSVVERGAMRNLGNSGSSFTFGETVPAAPKQNKFDLRGKEIAFAGGRFVEGWGIS